MTTALWRIATPVEQEQSTSSGLGKLRCGADCPAKVRSATLRQGGGAR